MKAYDQFVRAAEGKDAAAIVRLIREHPELHSYEGEDGCLLDIIEYHCPELFESAFVAGLHPDAKTSRGILLHGAACESDLELLRLCLRHGADIERRNDEGETALGFAVSWGSLETVRLLVEAGADVNAIEGLPEGYLSTALDSACSDNPEYDRREIRAYLREHGARRYRELFPPESE
jgi:hypothetical protein